MNDDKHIFGYDLLQKLKEGKKPIVKFTEAATEMFPTSVLKPNIVALAKLATSFLFFTRVSFKTRSTGCMLTHSRTWRNSSAKDYREWLSELVVLSTRWDKFLSIQTPELKPYVVEVLTTATALYFVLASSPQDARRFVEAGMGIVVQKDVLCNHDLSTKSQRGVSRYSPVPRRNALDYE